jgi:hypothetical protein
MVDKRRKFERIMLPADAGVYVTDSIGNRVGSVRVLGRGGMLVETAEDFAEHSPHEFVLVDESEGINRDITAVVRYRTSDGVAFEFRSLDVDGAVEIGIIIGKHYASQPAEA